MRNVFGTITSALAGAAAPAGQQQEGTPLSQWSQLSSYVSQACACAPCAMCMHVSYQRLQHAQACHRMPALHTVNRLACSTAVKAMHAYNFAEALYAAACASAMPFAC